LAWRAVLRRRSKDGMGAPTCSAKCRRAPLLHRRAAPCATAHASGRHARLCARSKNVTTGPQENRMLLTGLHVVADIYCRACENRLGWKYLSAFEETQKYKEGKYILEKEMIFSDEGLVPGAFRERDVRDL